MRSGKSRQEREAEADRRDREHSARLAEVSAQATRPPLFCQRCEAKLKPSATSCHYCGSADLGPDQPSLPRFSVAAVDGRCPRCHGSSFTAPGMTAPVAAAGFLVGGVAGALAGAAAAPAGDLVICATCGKRFRRG